MSHIKLMKKNMLRNQLTHEDLQGLWLNMQHTEQQEKLLKWITYTFTAA